MSAAFTPGPWRLDDGERHHNLLSDEYHAIDAGPGFYAGPNIGGFCLTGFMTGADAQLIASAPTMLAALQDCREALRRAGATGELAVVDAALAKATGEPA